MFVSVSENSINFIGAIETNYNFSYYILPPQDYIFIKLVGTLFIIDRGLC